MYRRILVPLDGSRLAEITLSYATEMATRLSGVEINLLHVSNPKEDSLLPMHRAYIEQAADSIRCQLKEGMMVKVKGKLIAGYPADEIINYTARQKIDLIIMATHGRSGVNRWAMGSIAYKVMRSVAVPVCLVRAGISKEMIYIKSHGGTILVPLDGTRQAESVLPHTEALVKQLGADEIEVVLLRVCEPPEISSDYPYSMPLKWDEHVEQEQIKCKLVAGVYLAEIGKRLKDAGIRIRTELPMGKPAEEII